VNKRVIESLIKAGAFDSIDSERARLVEELPEAMDLGQQEQRDRSLGQLGLFGSEEIGGGGANRKRKEVPAWEEKERLAHEKETLGFYLTGHPLASYLNELRHFSEYNTQNISDAPKNGTIRIGGIVEKIKLNTIKQGKQQGKKMANITLEDMEGHVEVTVFHKTFDKAAPYLEGIEPVLVLGNLETDNDAIKVRALEVIPLSEARRQWKGNLTVRVHTTDLARETLISLKKLLLKHKGKKECHFHFFLPDKRKVAIRIDHRIKIRPSEELVKKIEELVGENSVYYG